MFTGEEGEKGPIMRTNSTDKLSEMRIGGRWPKTWKICARTRGLPLSIYCRRNFRNFWPIPPHRTFITQLIRTVFQQTLAVIKNPLPPS